MSVFLVLSAPLWLLAVVSFYPLPGQRWKSLFIPFLGGLAAGIAVLVLTLTLLTRVPFGAGKNTLFAWAWIRGPGWAFLLPGILLALQHKLKPSAYSRVREVACWLGGISFVYSVWLALSPDAGFDACRVLFLPVFWLGASAGSAWMLGWGAQSRNAGLSWLLPVSGILWPSLTTFLPVLYVSGYIFVAWAVSVFLLVIFGLMIFLDSRGWLS